MPIADDPSLLPTALSPDGQVLSWQPVGACPFQHSSAEWSLMSWNPNHAELPAEEIALERLGHADWALDCLEPSLFVFHMSRCGSSLLARALAQDPGVIVMSEPALLNQLLAHLCREDLNAPISDEGARRILRNVILALGRRRTPAQRAFATKFTSWNSCLASSIQAAFPSVPCLFVYREPLEVMVSLLEGPAGFMRNPRVAQALTRMSAYELERLDHVEYVARCVERLMRNGLDTPGMRYLGYTDLRQEHLPALTTELGLQSSPEALCAMSRVFDLDAKKETGVPFWGDSARKRARASDEVRAHAEASLRPLHLALEASADNLRSVLSGTPDAG